jgi:hypothetical protein
MSMRQEPELYALVDEPSAAEAYAATELALFDPAALELKGISGSTSDDPKGAAETSPPRSFEEILAVVRDAFQQGHRVGRNCRLRNSQTAIFTAGLMCDLPKHRGGGRFSLLSVGDLDTEVMPKYLPVPDLQPDLSISVSAALLGRVGQENMDRIFLAMCAPDANSRVKMGAYNMLDKLYERYIKACGGWLAPLEMAAMYHGNHEVARDLAFSWFHLYRGDTFDSVVHLSLDEVMARVEAAPRGSSIGISSRTEHVVEHGADEWNTVPIALERRTPMNWCLGPRPRYPEDHELTREQVLATLQTPSETLLQALEAVAVPDAEWVEAEKRAQDILVMPKEDEKITWLDLDELEQREFLEAHAPYHVRRLQNGGVMLATHPYRYLWPLWAKALDLLGIRPATT